MSAQSPEYSPFQPDLDTRYPIGGIKFSPESKNLIINGAANMLQWASIFRNSPTNNMEAETLMGSILTEAMRAGQWVDMPEPLENEEIKPLTAETAQGTISIPAIPLQFRRGVGLLVNTGFVTRVQDPEGQRLIRPTEKFAEFVKQRIGFQQSDTESSSEESGPPVEEQRPTEEPPKSPRERIRTFAEVEYPQTQDINPKEMIKVLEEIKTSGFRRFTPHDVFGSVMGVFMGDSSYGVRMGVVKAMIAQALYSPDDFEKFARETSATQSQAAETEYMPAPGEGFLVRRKRPDEIRLYETYSAVYQTLAEIVHQIGEKYRGQNLSPDDILRLSEIGHIFSGKWNETGFNLTFTDPDIREFGTQLQQVVERVWRASKHEDIPKPLSEERLFPEKYPD